MLRALSRVAASLLLLLGACSQGTVGHDAGLRDLAPDRDPANRGDGPAAGDQARTDLAGPNAVWLFPYAPGRGIVPAVAVEASALTAVDVGPSSANPYACFSSLTDVFGGTDPALRDKFRADFAKHAQEVRHPWCDQPASPNVTLVTYVKPYLTRQTEYLSWLATNSPSHPDFLPARPCIVERLEGRSGLPPSGRRRGGHRRAVAAVVRTPGAREPGRGRASPRQPA